MPTYTVTAVSDQVRPWSYSNGTAMKSYRVTLRNESGKEKDNVEWSKPADAAPPKPGDTTPEGSSVDPSAPYGPKLVVPKRGGAAGRGGGFRDSPETRRSIAMQNSNAHAVEIVRIAIQAELWAPANPDVITDTALKIAEKFYRQVMDAEAGS